mgnify:FL=1
MNGMAELLQFERFYHMETQWSKGKIMRAAAVVLVAVMFGFGLLANGIWRNYRDAVLDR